MSARAVHPIPTAVSFIDCINRRDLDGLCRLMTENHTLVIFGEPSLVGRDASRRAWQGYFTGFPRYRIHPLRLAQLGLQVAVLGATTGSHLGLSDEQEIRETLIWLAEIRHGLISRWQLIEDSPGQRRRLMLDT